VLSVRLSPALLVLLFASPGGPATAPPPHDPSSPWASLEPGLDLASVPGPAPAPGDGRIWVLRIDPARFDLRLVNASAGDSRPRTVRAWALGAGAVAGINAGMFQRDGLTSVGLMRTRAHENNPRRATRFKAVLAFDPVSAGMQPVRIIDAACSELELLAPQYGTLIQSIRMVSCDRENVWAPDARRSSIAAVGIDGSGRALFIHARSAWSVHDVIEALLAAPVDLRRAMYLEGGPEAQLFARGGGREVERLGAFEGGGDQGASLAWEIPNALIAVRRDRPGAAR
jgi:hypothetical protein